MSSKQRAFDDPQAFDEMRAIRRKVERGRSAGDQHARVTAHLLALPVEPYADAAQRRSGQHDQGKPATVPDVGDPFMIRPVAE